jgi:pteridine reductase
MHYPNQVALITGGARRIGAAMARALHQTGINILLHYRHSEAEAMTLAAELNQIRENSALCLQADIANPEQCHQLIQNGYEKWHRLDILINNASSYFPTLIGETTEAQFDDLIGSNFKGPFFLSQSVKKYLAAQSGCILNIADINAIRPKYDYSVYCAAKAALLMLTKSLAKELAPAIRVNCIAPGPVLWPEGVNTVSIENQQQILAKIPMRRAASLDDICETALFLIQQKYLNGQIVCVDGGEI